MILQIFNIGQRRPIVEEKSIFFIQSFIHYLTLTSPFTWLTPSGSYRVAACRERELTQDHILNLLFDHKRTWRASPDQWSTQCRGHLRDNTNMKDDRPTYHTRTYSFQQGEYERRLWRPNIFGDLLGLNLPDMSYRWGKTQKKPHLGNLSRPEIEPGPVAKVNIFNSLNHIRPTWKV